MAISIDYGNTNIIDIPQADLTLVSGTLYELDTEAFRLILKDLEDNETGIAFSDTHSRAEPVTVAGTTYVQSLVILPPYRIRFEDGQYSVRLINSNNNIFDVEAGILFQNQVQVIPGNAAGLIITNIGSGLSAAEQAQLTLIADILEGDEEIRPGTYRVLQKDTKAELKSKTVTPTQGRTLDLAE